MKHALILDIYANAANLNEIRVALPGVKDSRIWEDEYSVTITKEDSRDHLGGKIPFNIAVRRDEILDMILDITGVLEGCEVGSMISLHTCHHDEPGRRECEDDIVYKVVE